MKFMHKLGFPLTLDTVHGLLANPDWEAQGCLLPTDPAFLTASRQALARNLASPCPEPGSPEDTALDDGLPSLADLAQLKPAQLLSLLAELHPSPDGSQGDPQPGSRDKGGKKPGKTTANDKNSKQYQDYTLNEKNTGKFPPAPENNPVRQPGQPRLPGQTGVLVPGPDAVPPARSGVPDLDVNILPAPAPRPGPGDSVSPG
jgi:hypothetical protein